MIPWRALKESHLPRELSNIELENIKGGGGTLEHHWALHLSWPSFMKERELFSFWPSQ